MAVGGAFVLLVSGMTHTYPGPTGPQPAVASPSPSAAHAAAGSTFHQIYLPDLLVIEPAGLSSGQLKKLSRVSGVRSMVSADGASIKLGNGTKPINVLGVNPEQFRSWTPLATASDQRLWTALQRGHFVTSDTPGPPAAPAPRQHRYRLGSAGQQQLILGGSAPLGIAGIGALVSSKYSAGLGLIPGVLALISAPGDSMAALTKAVRHIAGKPAAADQPAQPAAAAASAEPEGQRQPPGQLSPAVPGVGGPVLPRDVLDRAGRHRADRER